MSLFFHDQAVSKCMDRTQSKTGKAGDVLESRNFISIADKVLFKKGNIKMHKRQVIIL